MPVRPARSLALIQDRYDAVVIGGGPAGLRTAAVAGRHGASVLLLERSAGIGIPVRTSGASSIQELKRLGVPSHLWHPVRVIRFISPRNEAQFRYRSPLGCVLDVRALYQHLAAEAADHGVHILLRATAADLTLTGERAAVQFRHEQSYRTVQADVVVDASGHAAQFARKSGLPADRSRYGVGAEVDLYAPNFDADQLILIVGSRVAPNGYAWAFPYGDRRVRVGVGIIHPDSNENPSRYLESIQDRVPELAAMLRGAQPIEMHSGAIPSTPPNKQLTADRLLVVGDAAGQASTLVGEGIRFALMAGDFAGNAIGELYPQREFGAQALYAHYEAPWRRRWGRSMRISYAVNRAIARYDDATWDDRVDLLKGMSPELFSQTLHADFSPALLLRLMRHAAKRPKMLARALVVIGREPFHRKTEPQEVASWTGT